MKKNLSSEKALKVMDTLNLKFGKILYNYFPDLKKLLKNTDDKRHQSYIDYPREYIHLFSILSFLFRVKSSNTTSISLLGRKTIDNINALLNTNLDKIINNGTLSYFYNYEDYSSDELLKIPTKLIKTIIRKRTLEKYRLQNKYYLIAIDGTGIASFKTRHCNKCLKKTRKDGSVYYFHNVLTAQLVINSGYTFPIDFEFIENTDNKKYNKQDSEYNAFKRILPRLIKKFPQEFFCLLLDGLYADSVIMSKIPNRWKFFIALKDKDFKTVNEDFDGLKKLLKKNYVEYGEQSFNFVNDMEYKDCKSSIIESKEPHSSPNAKSPTLKLKYLTNFHITKSNVIKLLNKGGRLRGIIENEGYNVLKNYYFLEHLYKIKSLEAIKSTIVLACLAYTIFQFIIIGTCKSKDNVKFIFKTLNAFTNKLKEMFINYSLGDFKKNMRISFDSS